MESVVSSVIGAVVVVGALFDAELNQLSNALYPRSFRWRRLMNWLPLGIAYAAFYMARYNIAAGNIDSVRNALQFTVTDMGWIISSGSWAYALSAPFTGQITDRIGGQRGMLVACVLAAACNLALGTLFVTQAFSLPSVISIYAFNVLSQGFGTSAVVKINASWYAPSERGVFSGVFNILVASGYYLALGSGHTIITFLGWPYLFFIPGALLVGMALVVATLVANEPPTSTNMHEAAKPLAAPPTKFSTLLANKTLWGYLAAVFCLSWTRDGLLNWMYSFFDTVRPVPLTADDHAILGGAWTLGGFVGGVLCGWISDTVFQSRRMPPVILFSVVLAVAFVLLYLLAATLPIVYLGGLVFLVSIFLLGNYTLLSYTVPADLPVDVAAGASGLFTAVGYFATGLAGVAMGSCIQTWGYTFWIISLVVTSLATALCTIIGSYWSQLEAQALSTMDETTPLTLDGHTRRRSRVASIVRMGADFVAVPNEEEEFMFGAMTPGGGSTPVGSHTPVASRAT
ncbi:Aste57867_12998 [Aphanomyces stellatus]|uniref:Aste57867_12998 protein n=1 Tax=Aphanomyces stellatus TaxID=120398 RepID=A0A485KYN2_9STRA|nr:hypothetical protein As57867_012950 [Aphanomyces stellatus]VFT89844.1 Aste57867_12998 [Aphanomyces stellatus]